MSRCAACNKVLTSREMVISDRFFKQDYNDLCTNCRGIVADPFLAEYIDSDGPDAMFHQERCPSPEDGDKDG